MFAFPQKALQPLNVNNVMEMAARIAEGLDEMAMVVTKSCKFSSMPRISQFYGIAIYMYYRDHAPPHFHAIYGEHDSEIDIASAEILEGQLPPKARNMVTEWAAAHRTELQRNWDLARARQPLEPIASLE